MHSVVLVQHDTVIWSPCVQHIVLVQHAAVEVRSCTQQVVLVALGPMQFNMLCWCSMLQ